MATGAVAAVRYENADDFVAGYEIAYAGAGFDYFTSGFVAQDHGHDARTAAIDDAEVGMTEASGANADEHFAGTGRIEFALLDG
jgi:hypothetical protein